MVSSSGEHDLTHHGDQDVTDGLIDFAVNVRLAEPPRWLARELRKSVSSLASYPDVAEATKAVAARHGRAVDEALVTCGAAEAFTLVARALRPRHAVVVHPQFTEPEAALRNAGHAVDRVILSPGRGFALTPSLVPETADLIVVGNPTNPTSVLHPAETLMALRRTGRVLLVDEAFADAVPGEPESLVARREQGLLVVRSLTKTWGIAGLRAGYVVGDAELVAQLRCVQPPWSVSTPAAVAVVACSQRKAETEATQLARQAEQDRAHLVACLNALGVSVNGCPRAPFVLVKVHEGDQVRIRLRELGYAVRRGDTFPGLSSDWLRVAVRDRQTTDRFLEALRQALADSV